MDSNTPTLSSDQGRFYVYIHCRADDGEPFYAGKGSGRRAWAKTGRSAWWKRIVAKHGLIVKIQKHFQDESEAFASEIETIAILRDLGYELCNLTDGGEGASGSKHTSETRGKISKANSTPEARAAQAERQRQYWADPKVRAAQSERTSRMNRQRWTDPEYRAAQLERTRQQWSSLEFRQAMSERSRRQWDDPEYRAYIGWHTRQRMASPEARAKISAFMSGENSPSAKLSDEACRQIFRLRAQGLSQTKIAAQVGCSQKQVCDILRGKKRRNIYAEFNPSAS